MVLLTFLSIHIYPFLFMLIIHILIFFCLFLQALLKDSSHVLLKALDQRAYFKSVIIVVPSSWRDSKCQTIIRPPSKGTPYQNADIVVSDKHSLYNNEPFTQQSSGCGQPGDYIKLPYSFVTNYNSSFEDGTKQLVKEWAKFKYGIFDEMGFQVRKLDYLFVLEFSLSFLYLVLFFVE